MITRGDVWKTCSRNSVGKRSAPEESPAVDLAVRVALLSKLTPGPLGDRRGDPNVPGWDRGRLRLSGQAVPAARRPTPRRSTLSRARHSDLRSSEPAQDPLRNLWSSGLRASSSASFFALMISSLFSSLL